MLATLATSTLVLMQATDSPSQFSETLSLIGTVQKLLWVYMQREACTPAQQGWPIPASQQKGVAHNQCDLFTPSVMSGMTSALARGILRLDNCIGSSNSTRSCTCNICIGIKSTFLALPGEHVPHSELHVQSQVEAAGEVSGNTDTAEAWRPYLVHRLQAVTIISVVQLCACRLEQGGDAALLTGKPPEWLMPILHTLDMCHNSQLINAATTSLLSLSSETSHRSRTDFSVLWERYAVAHLHGRLLPGCCNLECTNMDGVSEISLKTLLCSRCRRARYCCVDCQKAAWVRGGHSTVCVESLYQSSH